MAPPYTEWNFTGDIVRMPEFTAPALGNKPNLVTIDADIPANANGVLYKLGANSGGLTCFVEDGILCYEYNLFIIQRTKIRAEREAPRRQGDDRGRDDVRRAQARRPAEGHAARRTASRRDGVVPVSAPLCSPPTTASTSASPSARPCRSTTATRHRSSSTASSTRCTSNISQPRSGQGLDCEGTPPRIRNRKRGGPPPRPVTRASRGAACTPRH